MQHLQGVMRVPTYASKYRLAGNPGLRMVDPQMCWTTAIICMFGRIYYWRGVCFSYERMAIDTDSPIASGMAFNALRAVSSENDIPFA
jgi:hypothetical protein